AGIDPITSEQVAEAASQLARTEDALETADRERLQASHRWEGAQRHAQLQERRNKLLGRKAELDAIVGDAVNIRTRADEHTRIEKMIEPATAALAELHGAAAAAAAAEGARTRLEDIDLTALESPAAAAQATRPQL